MFGNNNILPAYSGAISRCTIACPPTAIDSIQLARARSAIAASRLHSTNAKHNRQTANPPSPAQEM